LRASFSQRDSSADARQRRWGTAFVALTSAVLLSATAPHTTAESPQELTFRSGVARVTVSAVVSDRKGRMMTTLTKEDFEIVDAGVVRPITDFQSEPGTVSVALLIDTSGSMQIGPKLRLAREAASVLIGSLWPGRDEAALFTFDSTLRELQPFTTNLGTFDAALTHLAPFGSTSLHDAIADLARHVEPRVGARRAIVVFTDGIDTSSRLSASEVSGIASDTDVPIYIVALLPATDLTAAETVFSHDQSSRRAHLGDLARWTGGDLFVAVIPVHVVDAVRQLLTELRHQYLIAFEPSPGPGWHPLEVRTRDRRLTVRARSGYR
jgi:Ca-activated chloride channel family protein